MLTIKTPPGPRLTASAACWAADPLYCTVTVDDWQRRRVIYSSITTNTRHTRLYDVTRATTSLGDRNFQLHSDLMGPPSHMWLILDQNIIMQRMTVLEDGRRQMFRDEISFPQPRVLKCTGGLKKTKMEC